MLCLLLLFVHLNWFAANTALRLAPLAEEYNIPRLKKKCEEALCLSILSRNSPTEDILGYLAMADEHNMQALWDRCLERVVTMKISELRSSSSFKKLPPLVVTHIFEEKIRYHEMNTEIENLASETVERRTSRIKVKLKEIIGSHDNHCGHADDPRHDCCKVKCGPIRDAFFLAKYHHYCYEQIGHSLCNNDVIKQFIADL
jgi:hypothetical protein